MKRTTWGEKPGPETYVPVSLGVRPSTRASCMLTESTVVIGGESLPPRRPMSVCTQPGSIVTTTDCGCASPSSSAASAVAMLRPALEVRLRHHKANRRP